mmetsp:Transcript_9752/g.18360  ORF Transcript_9752/g.18360 Transcript_9752/m.18360 type:complete len:227 (+) Transcript_9752:972-1652(+)
MRRGHASHSWRRHRAAHHHHMRPRELLGHGVRRLDNPLSAAHGLTNVHHSAHVLKSTKGFDHCCTCRLHVRAESVSLGVPCLDVIDDSEVLHHPKLGKEPSKGCLIRLPRQSSHKYTALRGCLLGLQSSGANIHSHATIHAWVSAHLSHQLGCLVGALRLSDVATLATDINSLQLLHSCSSGLAGECDKTKPLGLLGGIVENNFSRGNLAILCEELFQRVRVRHVW